MGRCILSFGLALTFVLSSATAFAQTFGAVLTGSQEVPATTSPGFGNFTGTFDSVRANLTVTLTVASLGAPINGFHIHEKASGSQSGPVVVNLQGLGGTFVNNRMTGTFPVPADVGMRMVTNPSNFYVNVHTTQFPGGAIRGELAIVSGNVVTYAADLQASFASDIAGSAFISIDTIKNTLAWEWNTNFGQARTAYIGQAPMGMDGPPLINLPLTGGSASIAGVSPDVLNALLTNPASFYVRVYSADAPTGCAHFFNGCVDIRGQLTPANEYDLPIAGHVTNGLGQTFVTDVRVFNPSYDTPTTALLQYFPAGTAANANATASLAVDVPARGTAVLDDVTGGSGQSNPYAPVFSLNSPGSTGALRISSAAQLVVTSRIYADFRASGKGTLGQFAAGTPRGNALRRGALPQLANQSDFSSGSRTNIGFFNPTNQLVTARLELRSTTGSLVGSSVVMLQPLSQQQNSIASYFSGVDLSAATNFIMTFDASAPIVGYASVVDNVSTDQTFVYAQADPGVATNQ